MMRWLTLISMIILCSCKKNVTDTAISPSFNFSVNTTASMPCTGTGTVTINDLIGNNEYKIGNGNYQPSPVFLNVKVGNHIITVKDLKNREQKKAIIVDTMPSGTLFKNVKELLVTRCTPCHIGFNPQSGFDWSNVCDVINSWDRINERAVLGNPSPMPQSGLLLLAERNKIIDWINAGHGYAH